MGLIGLLGVILVILGVISLFIHLFATVGAIPLIVIGLILAVVGYYFHSNRGWAWSGWRGGPGPGPGGPTPF